MFWISLFVCLPLIWPLKCLSFDAQFQITYLYGHWNVCPSMHGFGLPFLWPLKCLSFDARFRITFFYGHWNVCPSMHGFGLPFYMAIELSVLRCTVSGYLLCGHWNVCPSMHGFYLFGIFKLFLQYVMNIKICRHVLINVWQRLTKSYHTLRWIFLQSLMKFD